MPVSVCPILTGIGGGGALVRRLWAQPASATEAAARATILRIDGSIMPRAGGQLTQNREGDRAARGLKWRSGWRRLEEWGTLGNLLRRRAAGPPGGSLTLAVPGEAASSGINVWPIGAGCGHGGQFTGSS